MEILLLIVVSFSLDLIDFFKVRCNGITAALKAAEGMKRSRTSR
jgi:hypothetical protein